MGVQPRACAQCYGCGESVESDEDGWTRSHLDCHCRESKEILQGACHAAQFAKELTLFGGQHRHDEEHPFGLLHQHYCHGSFRNARQSPQLHIPPKNQCHGIWQPSSILRLRFRFRQQHFLACRTAVSRFQIQWWHHHFDELLDYSFHRHGILFGGDLQCRHQDHDALHWWRSRFARFRHCLRSLSALPSGKGQSQLHRSHAVVGWCLC